MKRKIIKIDREQCNGCGLCIQACHEGAIGMVEGKAMLLRDDYCDGLGNCLPVCPTGAITFEEREAAAYNEAAIKKIMHQAPAPCGCPGTNVCVFNCNDSKQEASGAVREIGCFSDTGICCNKHHIRKSTNR